MAGHPSTRRHSHGAAVSTVLPLVESAPHNAAGHSPLRRLQSVRRTSSIDTTWPQGFGQPARMIGRARDVWTGASRGAPEVLAEDCVEFTASPQREILAIESVPPRAELQRLVGVRAGGHSRTVLSEVFADESEIGTPLYLLLDDFAGASLVAGWAWSRWGDDWKASTRRSGAAATAARKGKMENICAGFRPGSTALNTDDTGNNVIPSVTPVPALPHPHDARGWHELTEQDGVGMRRARRIDVWRDGDTVCIDAAFQDSATSPAGGRIAVHEYLLSASVDARDFVLRTLHVDPRILPYRECPGATPNAQRMIGTPLRDMRLRVLRELPGVLGCTHLNDVLRSLADVPRLASRLEMNSCQ